MRWDASVSLVKVGASAVEVSSHTALTLSLKNPDRVSAEMSDVEGGMASHPLEAIEHRPQFLGISSIGGNFCIPEAFLFPFQQVSLSFHLSDPCHMQSISERARLYRLSHIMTFRFAVLQSLSDYGISGQYHRRFAVRFRLTNRKGWPATWSRVHRRCRTAESSTEIV